MIVIRVLFTAALLWLVYVETGWWTPTILMLVCIALELQEVEVRRLRRVISSVTMTMETIKTIKGIVHARREREGF